MAKVLPVLWMTGLPSSGKTTLAYRVAAQLALLGYRSEVIDGDELRSGLCSDLTFSCSGRLENAKRAVMIARFLLLKRIIPVVALVSPYREARSYARTTIGEGFLEIYLDCPLEECARRDAKGLYKKAALGLIEGMTGVDAEYEVPTQAELTVPTFAETPSESTQRIIGMLKVSGYLIQ